MRNSWKKEVEKKMVKTHYTPSYCRDSKREFNDCPLRVDDDFDDYYSKCDVSKMLPYMAEKFNLSPDLIQKAEALYDKIDHSGLVNRHLMAACIYAVLKKSDCKPITLNRFLKVGSGCWSNQTYVGRYFRKMYNVLPEPAKLCYLEPTMFALDLARKLGFKSSVRHRVEELCKTIVEQRMHNGKMPIGLAGAVCYLVQLIEPVNNKLSQRKIAEIVGITETTLRNNVAYIISGFKKIGRELKFSILI